MTEYNELINDFFNYSLKKIVTSDRRLYELIIEIENRSNTETDFEVITIIESFCIKYRIIVIKIAIQDYLKHVCLVPTYYQYCKNLNNNKSLVAKLKCLGLDDKSINNILEVLKNYYLNYYEEFYSIGSEIADYVGKQFINKKRCT